MSSTHATTKAIALVTGVGRSQGIGYEVCRQLAKAGTAVLLSARDLGRATAAAQQLAAEGLDVRPYALDITQDASVRALVEQLAQEFGRLDILVNNASSFSDWSELASTADLIAVRALFESNLFGAWRTIQHLLPLIRKSASGRIVNVSSGAGSHGDTQFGLTTGKGGSATYGISKAALNALTAKLAAELAGSEILINAVCPGFTATAPGMEAMGARPVADGAAGIVWAATLPADGPSGGFFRDGQPLPW